MAQQVPQEISVGNTTYLHTPLGTKDWFTAQGKEGQAEHMWMYNIDASRNAVYFANKATNAVVWTLPDVNESDSNDATATRSVSGGVGEKAGSSSTTDGGGGIAMRVKGANPSSRWSSSSANNSPSGSRPGSAMGHNNNNNGANVSNTSFTSSSHATAAAAAAAAGEDASPKTVESTRDKLRERLRARLGTTSLASTRSGSAHTTPTDMTHTAVPQSPSPTQPTTSSEGALTDRITNNSSPVRALSPGDASRGGGGGGSPSGRSPSSGVSSSLGIRSRANTMLSVTSNASSAAGSDVSAIEAKQARGEHLSAREKLALRRAGRGAATPQDRSLSPAAQPQQTAPQQVASPSNNGSGSGSGSFKLEGSSGGPPTSATTFPPPAVSAASASSPIEQTSPTTSQQQLQQQQLEVAPSPSNNNGGGAQAALEKALAEERRRTLLEQDAQIQVERDELIRQERVAIERAKRLQEAQVREQELLLKAITERRAMEERRSELERQRLAKKANMMLHSPNQGAGSSSSNQVTEADLLHNLQLALKESGVDVPSTPLTRQQSQKGGGFGASFSGSSFGGRGGGHHHHHHNNNHHGAPPHHPNNLPGSSSSTGHSNNSGGGYSQLEARVQDALHKGRHKGEEMDEAFGDDFDDHLGGEDAAEFEEEHRHQAASAPIKMGSKPKDVNYSAHHSYTGTMYGTSKHGHGLYRYNASDFDKDGHPLPGGGGRGAGGGRGDGDNSKPILYEGMWGKNMKHGEGIISLPNSLYEGDWAQDLPHGSGTMQTSNMKADAKFRKGKAQGGAVIQLKSGATYTGSMKQSKVSSPGCIQLSNRDKVEWRWSDPNVAGSGEVVITFGNGDHYAGTIRNYVLHGAGYLRFMVAAISSSAPSTPAGAGAGGAKQHNDPAAHSNVGCAYHEYSGQFTNGIMEGTGVYRFDSGALYEGTMKAGLFHGVGTFSAPPPSQTSQAPNSNNSRRTSSSPQQRGGGGDRSRSPIAGLNQTEQQQSDSPMLSPMSVTGSPPNNTNVAGGKLHQQNPSSAAPPPAYIYSGEWRQGKMHGRGVITYGNGDVWEGNFSSDRRVDGRYTHSEEFQLVAPSSTHHNHQTLGSGGGGGGGGVNGDRGSIINQGSGKQQGGPAGSGGGGLERQSSRIVASR